MKEKSEKDGLKLSIQKTKIMASDPITSWQIDGETMEMVRYFIFLSSKIIVDGDCSYEIKRCLLLGRKAMTNLHTGVDCHFPLQGILPGIEFTSLESPILAGGFFTRSVTWDAKI